MADASLPMEPPGIARLPKEARGFPIPAHVARLDEVPIRLTEFDPNRLLLITAERRCTICGWVIEDDELCWWPTDETYLAEAERLRWKAWEPVLEGVGHKECIYFSAVACPYLSIPAYVRKTDQRADQAVIYERGTVRSPVVLCGAPSAYVSLNEPTSPTAVAGGGEREVRRYAEGNELVPELEAMIASTDRQPTDSDLEFAALMASTDSVTIGNRVQQAFIEIAIRQGIHVREPGRNAACLCGSGRSFKRCCIDRLTEARRLPRYPS